MERRVLRLTRSGLRTSLVALAVIAGAARPNWAAPDASDVGEAKPAPQYRETCDGCDAQNCYSLAVMYQRGAGGVRDIAKAAQLYQKACDSGHTKGCWELGGMYYKGEGVPQGCRSRTCTLQAGLRRRGCGRLQHADLYERGDDVPQDKTKASQLYRKACDGGISLGRARFKQLSK